MGAELVTKEFPIQGKTEEEQVDNLFEDFRDYVQQLEDEQIQSEIQSIIDNSEEREYDTAEKIESLSDDVYNNPLNYEIYSYTGTFLSSDEGLNVKRDTLFEPTDFVPGEKWQQPNAQRVLDGKQEKAYWLVGAWCSS